LIGLQLAHAGRKASISNPWSGGKLLSAEQGGWQREAPSPISFQEGAVPPHEMTESDINKVIDDFRTAADRSLKAGYDVVEIHAAHGYLLHEFLSPLTNHRTDAYGGSFENRIRLVLEVVKAVKQSWPESKPLFLRISASDWAEGGWPTDEAVELSKILKEKGVDVLDCSSGGLVLHQKIPVTPGYQVPFSDLIRKEAGALTAAVGLITTAKQAEQILEEDKADLIFIAREFLRDPYFPIHAAKELGVDIKWPVKYERAK
jgi:2,4-dienoyl-CoA reductase-like NADH-dependent reductase (Old Yellow Enzyme family)